MNKKQKKILNYLLIISTVLVILFQFISKEVRMVDVSFKERLQEYSAEDIPYDIHFSIINPKSRPVNCTVILLLVGNNQTNELKYFIGETPQRTKFKYKIQFNMPIGNTTINLSKNCKKI